MCKYEYSTSKKLFADLEEGCCLVVSRFSLTIFVLSYRQVVLEQYKYLYRQ
jgi:hypothetical protein